MSDAKIIILSQIIESKESAKELQFYEDSLAKLSSRLALVKREVQLTQTIIRMIKTEQIVKIRK